MVVSKMWLPPYHLIYCFSASVPVPVRVWENEAADRINGQFVCFVRSGSHAVGSFLYIFKRKSPMVCCRLPSKNLEKHTHILVPFLNLYFFAATIAFGSPVFFFFFPNRVRRILTDLFIWIRYKLSATAWSPPNSPVFDAPQYPRIARNGDVFLFFPTFFYFLKISLSFLP